MVGQIARLGQEVLERRLLDFLHLARTAIARIEILLEERAEVDLLEGVLLFGRRDGIFFRGGLGGNAVALFFLAPNVVQHGDGVFQFLKDRVLDHLGVDHVLELKLVEREHRDHLHEARRKDLPLRKLYVQFVLKKNHDLIKKINSAFLQASQKSEVRLKK